MQGAAAAAVVSRAATDTISGSLGFTPPAREAL